MPDNVCTDSEGGIHGNSGKDPAMLFKRLATRALVSAAGLSLAGTVLAGGCGSDALDAVAAGLNAAAQALNEDDQPTFGEWLLSELDDL